MRLGVGNRKDPEQGANLSILAGPKVGHGTRLPRASQPLTKEGQLRVAESVGTCVVSGPSLWFQPVQQPYGQQTARRRK